MNIVLFGSTGMLGRYIYNVLKNDNNIICINRDKFDIENDKWSNLDYLIYDNLKGNDIIINCAGIIPQKYENDNFKTYIRVNTLFPHKLNEISKKYNCKFIHITTDCVFDGSKGNYSINDIHTANDIYGISKSQGEPEDATIIRTSIIGEELYSKKSLIEWVKSNKNNKINGFTNHYWNGVTCFTLSKIIKKMIDENIFWKGIKHIYSPNIVTKYDLCCYINEIYNLNIEILPIQTDVQKNMTLTSLEFIFTIDNIYYQILEQKIFT